MITGLEITVHLGKVGDVCEPSFGRWCCGGGPLAGPEGRAQSKGDVMSSWKSKEKNCSWIFLKTLTFQALLGSVTQ